MRAGILSEASSLCVILADEGRSMSESGATALSEDFNTIAQAVASIDENVNHSKFGGQ